MPFKLANKLIISLLVLGVGLAFFGVLPFWEILLIIFSYLLFLLVVSTNVRFNFFVNSHSRNTKIQEKKIAISFDDGPSETTPAILKILRQHEAKAGFFCIGKNIETFPETFRQLIAEGHLVGNHTYSHTRKMGALGVKKLVWEIEECNRIGLEVGQVNMKLFRPPFGIVNPKTKKALDKTGLTSVGWSIRSFDAILTSEEIILGRIKKRIKPGAVILLHDNNAKTLNILEQLLLFLQENQYELVRPDKLLEINAYS